MIYACFRDIFITVTWLLLFFYYLYSCWYFLSGSACCYGGNTAAIIMILLSSIVIIAIFKELLNTVPVNILIDQNIVLHWHCCKSHNLSAIAITCTDFSQSIHCQFFILVHVQFVTKIVSMVRIGIGLPGSVGISLDLVQRRDN